MKAEGHFEGKRRERSCQNFEKGREQSEGGSGGVSKQKKKKKKGSFKKEENK